MMYGYGTFATLKGCKIPFLKEYGQQIGPPT
jgi:hypothetical protein